MAYAVYITESFEREMSRLPESDQEIIKKIFLQLKKNPYTGDAIRHKFFREKRVREKRIYYLIYDELSAVLVIAFGNKKAQQKTIDEIIEYLPEFKRHVENILKKENSS